MQLQLLTAIVKLFLKKPTETQELVQQVLSLATQVRKLVFCIYVTHMLCCCHLYKPNQTACCSECRLFALSLPELLFPGRASDVWCFSRVLSLIIHGWSVEDCSCSMDQSPTVPSVVHPALVEAYAHVVLKRMKTNILQNPVSWVKILSGYLCSQIQKRVFSHWTHRFLDDRTFLALKYRLLTTIIW